MDFTLFVWIILSIGALLIDVLTSSFLFVWFTIGGIGAIILKILGCSFFTQIIAFIVISSILMIIGYPLVKKTANKTVKKTKTMEENFIGKEFFSDEYIKDTATIKIEGIYWTVINKGEVIEKGDKFQITGLQGTKFLIKK